MPASADAWTPNQRVRHPRHGMGTVLMDRGETVIIRFTRGLEECLKSDLERVEAVEDRLQQSAWDVPLRVIARVQAEAITSVNESWGVYSPSRMELLPHQLWVCRQIVKQWPTRWLVADDVGLGKTVEAGMVLSALMSRRDMRRILIICPASLAEQWQERMLSMFDLRFARYTPEVDGERTNFWSISSQVIASLQTIRLDHRGRRNRLFEADPWDLVIVDEAHHLNADEQTGPTLGYRMVREMQERDLVESMVFFTGTPHRGKDFGFFALLELLRPGEFGPKRSHEEKLAVLPSVMIRNNKSNVTDLRGERLFQTPEVTALQYAYSPAEEFFYAKLTEFIATGRAYASRLSQTQGRAVMLVLIAMQKLASSSVAAVRRALTNRLRRIQSESGEDRSRKLQRQYEEQEAFGDFDNLAVIEEKIAEGSPALHLMQQEGEALEELLAAANAVRGETRIETIVEMVRTRYAGKSVLFFTEYKATQALLMSALLREFGERCVTFINGDERLEDVVKPNGDRASLSVRREGAAEQFNEGTMRFLISTEAGGEGIDLQENCHTLIHVDLPWNPMRMHQRVGRLNRYGQKDQVQVVVLHNPDTVESLIWQKLNEKLERVTLAHGQVMEEPEDMMQLVLGMTSPSAIRDLYARASEVPRERLSEWFDAESAKIASRDVVEEVRSLFGNVSRFDYREMSALIPQTDIPDLKPFLENMLSLNNRRMEEADGEISFLTPEPWRTGYAIQARYSGMVFDRSATKQKISKLLGFGHRIMDRAIHEARDLWAMVAAVDWDGLEGPLCVYRVRDRVTGQDEHPRTLVFGIQFRTGAEPPQVLMDWELVKRLNEAPTRKLSMSRPSKRPTGAAGAEVPTRTALNSLQEHLERMDHQLRLPEMDVIAILWPSERS